MRSLADPSLNVIEAPAEPVTLPNPVRIVQAKIRGLPKPVQTQRPRGPHFRGTKSGYKGVLVQKHCKNKPWKAYITVKRHTISLGYFATKEEAAKAYDKKAIELFGQDTFLNHRTVGSLVAS